jgi:hypothetical protein
MKKRLISFITVVIVVFVAIVLNKQEGLMNIAGVGSGKSLKEINAQQDTTKTSVIAFGEASTDTEGNNLFQALAIANWEHQYSNGLYFAADAIGCVSSQFGVCAPTCDFRTGLNFGNCKIEAKFGNFTRNNIKTGGFDPQFQNDLLILGEGVSVNNAMQLSLMTKNTKVLIGHQGGNKFYSLNGGNYYTTVEQTIKNFSVGGGVNFTEKMTGYAAAKLNSGNNSFTITANNLGAESQNFVFSYNRSNIGLGKGMKMNIGTALCKSDNFGFRMAAGLGKGGMKIFALAGGSWLPEGFKPLIGLGTSCKL